MKNVNKTAFFVEFYCVFSLTVLHSFIKTNLWMNMSQSSSMLQAYFPVISERHDSDWDFELLAIFRHSFALSTTAQSVLPRNQTRLEVENTTMSSTLTFAFNLFVLFAVLNRNFRVFHWFCYFLQLFRIKLRTLSHLKKKSFLHLHFL